MKKVSAVLFRAFTSSLLVFSGILASTVIGAVEIAPSFAHEREKMLTNGLFENSPVGIVSMTKNGQAITMEQQFQGGDDWLKGLEVVLENKFSKTITHIVVSIAVDDTTGRLAPDGISRVAKIVSHVAIIGSPTYIKDTEPTFHLLPGERHTVQFNEKSYEQLVNHLTELRMSMPDQAEIRIHTVMFDDDTKWSFGHMLRRNPQDPNKWDLQSSITDQKKTNSNNQYKIPSKFTNNLVRDGNGLVKTNTAPAVLRGLGHAHLCAHRPERRGAILFPNAFFGVRTFPADRSRLG